MILLGTTYFLKSVDFLDKHKVVLFMDFHGCVATLAKANLKFENVEYWLSDM